MNIKKKHKLFNILCFAENEELGLIRAAIINDGIWAVAMDVANILGYKIWGDALINYVKDEDKNFIDFDIPDRQHIFTAINERGFNNLKEHSSLSIPKELSYRIIYRSNQLPNNKAENNPGLAHLKNLFMDDRGQYRKSVTMGEIAGEYGMSAYELNNYLSDLNIQSPVRYEVNNQTWKLNGRYANRGYATTQKRTRKNCSGKGYQFRILEWTEKGVEFLYYTLKEKGKVPLIERKPINEQETYKAS